MKVDEEMKVRVSGVMLIWMGVAAGLCYAQGPPTTAAAHPPTYLPPEQRPIIAVMPFEDGAIEGDWGWWYGGAQWSAGTGISDMIASELIIVAQQKQNFRMSSASGCTRCSRSRTWAPAGGLTRRPQLRSVTSWARGCW